MPVVWFTSLGVGTVSYGPAVIGSMHRYGDPAKNCRTYIVGK